jgi:hypothetical protein
MKRMFLIFACCLISIMCTSCITIDKDDDVKPPLNNESFTNYIPWWDTNNLSGGNENVESN